MVLKTSKIVVLLGYYLALSCRWEYGAAETQHHRTSAELENWKKSGHFHTTLKVAPHHHTGGHRWWVPLVGCLASRIQESFFTMTLIGWSGFKHFNTVVWRFKLLSAACLNRFDRLETFLVFSLTAITQLTPGSIPKLVIRRCVFGKDILFIGSKQIFHCFWIVYLLGWPSLVKDLQTGLKKGA